MEASRSGIAPKRTPADAGSTQPADRAPGPERRSRAKPIGRFTPDGLSADLREDLRLRLRLQRRAQRNFRRHLQRAATRISVLVVADLAAFLLMRAALRAVRDYALLGPAFAHDVQMLMPRGALTGWQFPVAMFLGLLISGSYGHGDRRRSPGRLFVSAALAVALPLSWGEPWIVLEFVLTTVLIWVGLTAERLTIDRFVAMVRPPERDAPRAVFVGPFEDCRRAEQMKVFACGRHYRCLGFVDAGASPPPQALGGMDDLAHLIHQRDLEAVIICGHFGAREFKRVVETALSSGCELVSVPRTLDIPGVRPSFVSQDGDPLVTLTAPALKGQQLLIKRVFDLAASVALLLATAPAMLLIAAAIKLDSKGPVFFRQERVGRGGRRFGVWKFRTMVHGASDAAHRALVTRMIAGDEAGTAHTAADGAKVYKLVEDSRVTRVGAWLRRFSLDEMPQVLNVIVGDMSLVGPRPPLVYEVDQYDAWQYGRLQVRPGISGLWQVSGRSRLTYRQMCELDMDYIREWSLALDLRILLRTVPVVLFNSGRAA